MHYILICIFFLSSSAYAETSTFAKSDSALPEKKFEVSPSESAKEKITKEQEIGFTANASLSPSFSILGNNSASPNDEHEETKFSLFRYLGATALVIALIYLVLHSFLRRFMKKSLGNSNIQLVSQLPLGQKQSIRMYRIESKVYILGCTEHHISLIDTLSDTTPIEGTEKIATNQNSESAFTRLLKKYV